jgi:hypothetical protein
MGSRTQDFGENQNQNHPYKEAGLLSGSANTCIANNADGKAR